MINEIKTKEKILAIFIVFLLFFLVGGLFVYISYNNKIRTEKLRQEVLRLKHEQELDLKMKQISLDNVPLTGITAKAFYTFLIGAGDREKILAQKNPFLKLPIASITKLMTALTVLENIDLETEILATADYVGLEESFFIVEVGKTYKVKELLAHILISSDNDSARLLASVLGENNFINKMNSRAKEIGMLDTVFMNTTGLDPKDTTITPNISTVSDLTKLLIFIKNQYPQILRYTTQAEYNFCDINNFCKVVSSTNKFLHDKVLKYNILGGKTGSTDLAGKNLILLTEIEDDILLVNVVLGSAEAFADTASIINNLKTEIQ